LSVLGPEQATQPHAFSLVQSRRVDGLMLAGRDIPARFVLEPHANGFRIILTDNALIEATEASLVPRVVAMDETTHESGRDAMPQILDGGSAPRNGVNDAMALGVIHAVEADDLGIPDDVAVVGFDDLAWTALHRPALITVHIYKEQMAASRLRISSTSSPNLAASRCVHWSIRGW